MAARLAASGLEPGDRMLTSAETSAESWWPMSPHCALGSSSCPSTPHTAEREIAYIVRDARRRPRSSTTARKRGECHARRRARPVIVVSPDVELADGQPPALHACAPDDGAMLCYTSGTTGTPEKGAVLTHGNVLTVPQPCSSRRGGGIPTTGSCSRSRVHMHGLGVGLHGTLLPARP